MDYYVNNRQGKQGFRITKPLVGLTLLVTTLSPFNLSAAVWSSQEMLVFDLVNHQRGLHGVAPVRRNEQLHDAALAHSQSMSEDGFFSHNTMVGGNNEGPGERMFSAGYRFLVGGENIAAGHGRTLGNPPAEFAPQDAARHVMYGTTSLEEYNAFFTNPVSSWDEVGLGVSGGEWDDWHEYRLTPVPCDFDGDGEVDGECSNDGGWMGSQGHRETLLNEAFVDVGIGYVWDADDSAPILQGHFEGQQWVQNEIVFPLNTYWTQDFASPVPLPGAVWLLLSGLGGMVMLGRGRRKSIEPRVLK
jgi:uncharacterized protein YkwD